jgi:hypothetical protein
MSAMNDHDEDRFYGDELDGSARWHEFRRFALSVLKLTLGERWRSTAHEESLHVDASVDTLIGPDGQDVLVQVKLETPQTAQRLCSAAEELAWHRNAYIERRVSDNDPKALLAFPGVLAASRLSLLRSDQIDIWDGNRLTAAAHKFGVTPPFYVVANEDTRGLGYSVKLQGYGESWMPFEEPACLAERLAFLGRGKQYWRSYEDFSEELLTYLFVPPLSQVITQRADQHGVNRRDFILPNYAASGFWRFMRDHYDADFVVAEAKNLTDAPGKDAVLQVANYLSPRGTGLFGFILAREAMDSTALWVCREQWAMNGKMIIGLDDGDILQMIKTKAAGGEPADMIKQKIEDFRLRI